MHFLITGASTGIGEGCARWLDVRAHHVFAGVRRDEDAARLKAGSSPRLTPLVLDVTVEASIQASVAQVRSILEKSGADEQLDGLVNNAGIAVAGPLEYLPLLRRARGRIVFVGSVGGLWATPFLAPYCASKFALEAIVDCLRLELQPWGIHVSILEPGSIATPIWRKPGDGGVPADAPLAAAIERDYGSAIAAFRDIVAVSAKRGVSTDRTSVVIEHALTAPTPRTRYVVGRDAKVQAAIRKLLPDRLRDRLVARAMKLPART
jgi:NAD(P)-dependent dehydrogenase (short-subunit alcohol dehydrogenase family)